MAYALNATHDPELKSWVESAVAGSTDFPIQNLPLGIFRRRAANETPRVGVAIGDQILDLAGCASEGLLASLDGRVGAACAASSLNALMGLGPRLWSSLRRRVSEMLRADSVDFARDPARLRRRLIPIDDAELQVPATVGDYTDFYASVFHARNIGSMFRPDNPLFPNYKYVPIAYHGRASSIVVSGSTIVRPAGQIRTDSSDRPTFASTRELDYELEVGFFIGRGNRRGDPIPIDEAEAHIFGFCLVNDWSARDIQRWEYQPLGPFLAKSFATTVSPWVVTLEALQPFRVPAFVRPPGDPEPLEYLASAQQREQGGIDLELEVRLSTRTMRHAGVAACLVGRANFRTMYWTPAQMVTHHTSNGCNLLPGDLLASGTVSGSSKDSRGCLLEQTWRGEEPIVLPTRETRAFLADGDEVLLVGSCGRPGFVPIGFGACAGRIAAGPGAG